MAYDDFKPLTMVFHVGIDVFWGEIAAYNDFTKETIKFRTDVVGINDIKKVDGIYEIIKTALIGDELGFACLAMPDEFHNDIRQEFAKKGKDFGFKEVLIINMFTINYLDFLVNLKEKPKDGDLFWIFTNQNMGDNYCTIWKQTEAKPKMLKILEHDYFSRVSDDTLLKIKEDSGVATNPNFIITDFTNIKEVSHFVKNIFPDCKCIFHKNNLRISEVSLIKARIKGSDETLDFEIKNCDVDNYINGEIQVCVTPQQLDDDKEKDIILNLNDEGRMLPFKTSTLVLIKSNEKVLRISCLINSNQYTAKIKITSEMLRVGEIIFKLKMDENCIFAFDVSIIETLENTERRVKRFYENQIQTKTEIYDIPQRVFPKNLIANAVGIDLGMTRCAIAVAKNNGIELVAFETTERQLPSYVSFKEKEPICGQLVINQLQHYANFTIFDTKRMIGRSFDEVQISPAWPFEIIESSYNKPLIRVLGFEGTVQKYPEEVSSILLKYMKQKAEEFKGKKLDEVVVTVPAGFNMSQKIATHVAAEFAGWKTVHLLAEPIAASIAYFVHRPIPSNFNMILFDLGGGTLDLCVFKVEKNKLKIVTNDGDSNLGGRDFDAILFEHFSKILETNYNITMKERIKYKLLQKCVDIKHTLSTDDEATFCVDDFNPDSNDFIKITRQEFEKMSVPLLNRIQKALMQTFSGTGLSSTDINKILLVGGGCRMPMIQHFIRQMFDAAEHTSAKNPDEMVAIGAAYYASFIMSKSDKAACNIM